MAGISGLGKVFEVRGSRPQAGLSPAGFNVQSPVAGASLSGTVAFKGQAGSQWVNVAAFEKSTMTKIAPDAVPANGAYSISVDSTLLANGPATIALMAFSISPGQSGGTFTELDLSVIANNFKNSVPAPTLSPTIFNVQSPATGASLSGTVAFKGQAGSQWVNVAAFEKSTMTKIAPDAVPANGAYSISVDSTLLANGPATIALMAFSIPPGQSGGTFTEVDVDAIVNNVVTASAGPTAPGGFQPTGIPGNWTLTFDDEFSGNSLDTTKWNTNPGWTMITDDAYMSASEISVGNGSADLRVDNFSTGGAAFTSSMINTQNKYSFTYGVAEARIQIPRGNGVDAGFWLIPNNGSWPPEIDIIELVTQVANYAIMTYHWGSANNALPQYYGGPDYSAGFHIFSVNWQPGSITWYIDGAQRAQYAVSANITNLPMYIIVNPDVCSPGTWCAGDMSSNSYPMHMAVDYVRVWQ